MSPTKRSWTAAAAAAGVLTGLQLMPATAHAQPDQTTETDVQTAHTEPEVLHNVIYRARVDGVARGATITYTAQDNRIQSADPTMVPGRVFEVNTVLPASGTSNMRVAIEWPYSANLHCEILIDGQVVAQADDFIGPTVLPQRDDPDYGALVCEAPVSGVPNVVPADPNAPPPEEPPPAPPM